MVLQREQLLDPSLTHHGVKGMKWGVRKDQAGVYQFQTSTPEIDPSIHSTTKNAAIQVSALMGERYGMNIKQVKVIGPGNPYYPETAAYVEMNGKNSGEATIFVQAKDMSKEMKLIGDTGWMAPGTANEKGLLTHESAHSLFHAPQKLKPGFLGPKVVGGNIEARDKALKAAIKAARKDGLLLTDASGYAKYSGYREEVEAEMFSQYHWADNPPRFVVVWGQTLHKELGIDPTPFKEVKHRV